MKGRVALALLLVLAVPGRDALDAAALDGPNPVAKVVGLLTEMKAQVQKEADEDRAAYDKYECWCQTHRGKKTEAVAVAEKRIDEHTAFLEEAAGKQSQLKTEIGALEADVVEDQDALAAASSLKMKETAEFETSEKDAKETMAALDEALSVLSKVQFLQRFKGKRAEQESKSLLIQLRTSVEGVNVKLGAYRGAMQKDLWDVMSSLDEAAADANVDADGASGDFLAPTGASRSVSALGQLRAHQSPGGLTGGAAGASSYSARSSGIVGILSEMKADMEKNLIADQKMELEAMVSFYKLKAAKTSEISIATQSSKQKAAALADSQSKAAQSKEDLDATTAALSADEKFLVGLEDNCKANQDDYASRSKTRSEELVALAETIKVLTQDDARDLFGKTISFFQVSSADDTVNAAHNRAVDFAMRRLLKIAKKHHNWILASLAVRVRLDAFTKVKEAMDKMTADLKAEHKAEFEKHDFCRKEIDETEDALTVKGHEKEDLQGEKSGLENSIDALKADLEALRQEISDAQVSLKQAGEDRKAENLIFQQSISDQRATLNILEKAKTRLAKFYASNASFVQVRQLRQEPPVEEPGAAVEAPPPKPKEYSKSGGGGGVIQLLDKIMSTASAEEAKLITSEQSAQKAYESIAQDINEGISADNTAIAEKTRLMEEAESGKSEKEAALISNEEELAKLADTLKGVHLDCDFLIKFFDVRQQARQEELSSIAEAKAILSGADFGKDADDSE